MTRSRDSKRGIVGTCMIHFTTIVSVICTTLHQRVLWNWVEIMSVTELGGDDAARN